MEKIQWPGQMINRLPDGASHVQMNDGSYLRSSMSINVTLNQE
ncbi:MAG: hypothetical protein WAO23_09540 [Dethiobacteria bacterium]